MIPVCEWYRQGSPEQADQLDQLNHSALGQVRRKILPKKKKKEKLRKIADISLEPLVHTTHTHMNMHTHKHTAHTNERKTKVHTIKRYSKDSFSFL